MRTSYSRAGCLLLALSLTVGCVSGKTGTQIEGEKVTQIQKGVTTRDQVESLLGPPMAVSMMGDGRRMLMYYGSQANGKISPAFLTMGLVPASTKTDVRRQSLQIIISKADVVEDYEFSDTTEKQRTKTSAFGSKATSTTEQNKAVKPAE